MKGLIPLIHKKFLKQNFQYFSFKNKKYIIIKDDNKYRIISRICPHQGGLIQYKDNQLLCPLHNWYFSNNGTCLNSSQNAISAELILSNEYFYITKENFKLLDLKEESSEINRIRKKDIDKINDLPEIEMHSHATLELKFKNSSILFDPWIDGPAMLGSWRQYPKPVTSGKDLNPNFIIITHEHSDHFHLPTLKNIGKEKLIIFPNFQNNRIKTFLDTNNFTNYKCIDFEKRFKIETNSYITFFRPKSLFNDSIVLFENDSFRFLNLNDAGLNPDIAGKVGPVHLTACIFSTGASGYPLTWNHLDLEEKNQIMISACKGRLQMLEQALLMYNSNFILPFASHVKLWLEEHNRYRNELKSNTIIDVVEYFKKVGKSSQLIDMIPGDQFNLKDFKLSKSFYDRKAIYDKDNIELNIIRDRNSYSNKLISWDSGEIILNKEILVDHFTKELDSTFLNVDEDINLICEVYGNLTLKILFRFKNGKFKLSNKIIANIPNFKMRIRDKVLMHIISGYLSWDEAKVGYWIEWWRDTKKVHNSLTRAMQSPILPKGESHLWRLKKDKINFKLSISELIRQNKNVDSLLKDYGLFCNGCALSPWESIEDAAKAHGLNSSTQKKLFKKIENLLEKESIS